MSKECFIYNVTVKVSAQISKEWLHWLQQEHITEVMATGCFTHSVIMHLFDLDDTESVTYAIQYHAESLTKYETYIARFATALRQKSFDKLGDRFVAFRTLMKVVN